MGNDNYLAAAHLELSLAVSVLLDLDHYAISSPNKKSNTSSVLSSGTVDEITNFLNLLGLYNGN